MEKKKVCIKCYIIDNKRVEATSLATDPVTGEQVDLCEKCAGECFPGEEISPKELLKHD